MVAEKAVQKGGLVLPPGMLRGRPLGVLGGLQMAACLVPLLHPTMAALLPHTATTPQPPTLGPLSSATDPLSDVSVIQVDSCEQSSLTVFNTSAAGHTAVQLYVCVYTHMLHNRVYDRRICSEHCMQIKV